MIKRAERKGDPWSGHMAFPGGRAEQEDRHGLDTASRETREEIGLDTRRYTRRLGRLSDIYAPRRRARSAIVVAPYLFLIERVPPLKLNHEVADVVWVPLSFLSDPNNRDIMTLRDNGAVRELPCYFYKGQRIWGLSLTMLDELLSVIRS